jgi:hypothetical protein
VVVTDRLVLREWRDADLELFVAMNADPVVMQFFPETYTEERTRRFIARIRECWAERGYGLWAVEPRAALAYAFDTLGISECSVMSPETSSTPTCRKAIRPDPTSSTESESRRALSQKS